MLRYFHLPHQSITGGQVTTTVGYQRVEKGSPKLIVAFARCSENDTFNKKKAHLICEGRMRKGKCELVTIPENMDKYEFLTKLVVDHDKKVKDARTQKKASA